MKNKVINILILVVVLFTLPTTALAQDYYFQVEEQVVHAYWNADGTLTLDYTIAFLNDQTGHAIEFIDLGLPNYNFNASSITAEIDGQPVDYISSSEYQGNGSGVAVALGSRSIPPGERGTVRIIAPGIRSMLFVEDTDDTYASAVFAPSYFGSQYVYGETDMTVIYHLPPGVQPEEPRWHSSPKGFSEEPAAAHDADGRITYTWYNPTADAHSEYRFGASFPAAYVPTDTVVAPTVYDRTGIDPDDFVGFCICGSVFGFIALVAVLGSVGDRRRKMKYLPPKIRIEGHGIKRGLTAVEAAVLMEQPPDKVLTMILFAVVKKGAATVTSQDPLKLKLSEPLPQNLRRYEASFLKALAEPKSRDRRKKLQNLMVSLIKSVSKKMKGFSHKETVAYYKKIMEKAWQQVEAANTPQVKSEKFDEHMGWTMLDDDFDQRTQDVFRTGPVFVPMWWGRFDPSYAGSSGGGLKSMPKSAPSSGGGGGGSAPSLPTLPGGAFAASMASGMQNFAGGVVGNVTDFAGGITNRTNPVPKSTSRSGGFSSGGGGSSCACACACAGCACACAGGGR